MKRVIKIEKKLSCKFIRINPDENIFNIFKTKMKYLDTSRNQLKNRLKS